VKLTTKGRFAVTAMLDIAMHEPEEFVTIADISERRHLSSSYLEQLFGKLRKAGLLEGIRGPSGGYRLSRPSSEINVAQVLDAVDDTLKTNRCAKNRAECDGQGECITFDLWYSLNQEMRRYLTGITLKSLADKRRLEDQGFQTIHLEKMNSNKESLSSK